MPEEHFTRVDLRSLTVAALTNCGFRREVGRPFGHDEEIFIAPGGRVAVVVGETGLLTWIGYDAG
jgi:hypothetical protein